MKEEKEINKKLFLCEKCGKKAGVVFVVKEDGKIINKCTKCFYGKDKK